MCVAWDPERGCSRYSTSLEGFGLALSYVPGNASLVLASTARKAMHVVRN